jgi:hypothetical protein
MDKGASHSDRSEITRIRLEQALSRLLDGNPERTPEDGRLSLSRINQEAGLSSGGIYYYKDFIEKARKAILEEKLTNSASDISLGKISAGKMRAQRDKERELKERYRYQRDQIKEFCDKVITKNAQLEFALFESLDKIKELEKDALKHKVTKLK